VCFICLERQQRFEDTHNDIKCFQIANIMLYFYQEQQDSDTMRIIARKTLIEFYKWHVDAKNALETWYIMVKKQKWLTTQDIKDFDRSASIINAHRVVFNIHGNKYRLIVKVNYRHQCVYIRFIGTHVQYDKIDAVTI